MERVLDPGLDVVSEIDLSLVGDFFGRHVEKEVWRVLSSRVSFITSI